MRQLCVLVLLATGSVACNPRPLFLQPRPMREWPATLQAAKVAAREGRYAAADSLLAGFLAQHSGSYEAREAAYWRALFLLDPANRAASSAEAVRALNDFFAGGATAAAYDEADVLRRVVMHADSLERALSQAQRLIAEAQDEAAAAGADAAAAARAGQPAQPAQAPQRDARETRNLVDQVRRLREELSRANQELERVRRRLSEQRP